MHIEINSINQINIFKRLENLSEKHKLRWSIVITLVIIFLFEFIGTLKIVSITNNSSEYNVIAMAACFAGYDWRTTILKTHYYGYTSSILLAIIFLMEPIVNNPYLLLHGMLLVNVLINVLCAFILYKIVFKIIADNTKENRYLIVSLITIAVSLFLSNQVLTKTVTNENFFVLCCYLTVYILLFGNQVNNKKLLCINSIILAICNVMGYATNGRGIIWICITVMVLITFRIFKCSKIGYLSIYLICLILFFGISFLLKNQVENIFYVSDPGVITEMKNNDVKGIIERACKLINITGIKLYLKLVIGWGMYFVVSTYGMGIVAVVAAIRNIYMKIFKKEKISDCLFALSLISIFFLVGITVLGICFYHDSFYAMYYNGESSLANGRVDKLIYGRYISTIKGLIILLGIYDFLYVIKEKKDKIHAYFVYMIMYVSLSKAFLIWIQKRMIGKIYAAVDIPEFALFFGGLQKNYKFGIVEPESLLKITCIFAIIFMIILALHYYNKDIILLLVIIFLNIFFGIEYNNKLMVPRSEYYASLVNQQYIDHVNDMMSENEQTMVIVDKNAYLYQFYMPKTKVVSRAQASQLNLEEYDNIIIFVFEEKSLSKYMSLINENENIEVLLNESFDNNFDEQIENPDDE